MKPDGGSWQVMTREHNQGCVAEISWACDNSRIYYDRLGGLHQGIYSVAVPSGKEQLVWPNAYSPQALPDGSLLGVRLEAGKYQVFQFWPNTNKTREFPVAAFGIGLPGLRAFPDGGKAAVIGTLIGADAQADNKLFLIDLETGGVRRLETGLPEGEEDLRGLAISPDGDVLAANRKGVFHRILKIATNGNQPAQTLMGLTREVNIFDMDRDGNLYLEQFESPMDWLHVSPAQNHAERIAQLPVIPGRNGYLTCLPDDRVVLQLPSAGGFYLMLVDRGGERVPLAGTSEWASPPRDAGWARPDRVPDR